MTFVEETFFSSEVTSRVFSQHTSAIFCNQSILTACTNLLIIRIIHFNSQHLAVMTIMRAGAHTTMAGRMTLTDASIVILEESWRENAAGRV